MGIYTRDAIGDATMLDVANKYGDVLNKLLMDTWYNDKYMYYHSACYAASYRVPDSNYDTHQFVSMNKKKEIIGFIAYEISRNDDCVSGLSIVNFSDDKFTFGLDLSIVIRNIFEKYKFRKVEFCVNVGNPIEESYDKMIAQYGGRIVGVYKQRHKLLDGEYHDQKLYEIFREDYIKRRGIIIK